MQYEIFLEGGQERKTGYYKKRVSIIKAVIFKEVINIKAQKSARGRKYLQSGRYNIFLIIMYFILSYIILFYHFFAYLFIYLFILPQIDPGKKNSPLPLPDRGFSFCRLFRELRPPGGIASFFYRIDYGGSETSPRRHCLYLQRR